MEWSAAQYTRFEEQRSRPIRDILAAMPALAVRQAIDLGCGTGNSTALMAAHYPDAAVTGLDSSPDMIAEARRRHPEIRFDEGDIVDWYPASPPDLILSNAVLQWLPAHASLFPRLLDALAPGGCLAVQMPDNLDEPTHRLMAQVARDSPWADRLAQASLHRTDIGTPAWYHALLQSLGARVDVWRTVYHHELPGPDGIVEWFKGTGLRPFLDLLDEVDGAEYLRRYRAAVASIYPPHADGTVLLPFPRLFILAQRA